MSASVEVLKKTPLYDSHIAAAARMVKFCGWEMPIQYTSILKEHEAVRTAAGLFDISHMGEIRVKGPDVVSYLNYALTNNVEKLQNGKGQYSILLNENGGIVDDLFVYRLEKEKFLLIVNASCIGKDLELLLKLKRGDVDIKDESDETGALALQGPASAAILDKWIPGGSALGHHAIALFDSDIGKFWIARTGYTGEDGFEILGSNSRIVKAWEQLLKVGQPHGLTFCGLGARDTLRMEVCYPLNGHELGEDISPLEAGIGFFVDFTKADFHGKAALLAQKTAGVKRKSVALVAEVGAPPFRAECPVFSQGKKIGILTSGSMSPSLKVGIGLALIDAPYAVIENVVDVEIRGKLYPAKIVKKPIYRKE